MMKAIRPVIVLLLTGLLMAAVLPAAAQQSQRSGGSYVDRMAETLDAAGAPLDDAQKKKIEGLERGPDTRRQMNEILTDKQRAALQTSGSNRRTAGNMLRGIEGAMNDAKLPLTDDQKKKLRAVQPDRNSREEIAKILTEDQNKIYGESMRRRRGSRDPSQFIGRMLEGAGKPLTPEQTGKLKAIEMGPDSNDAIMAILSDEQKKLYEEGMANMRNRGPRDPSQWIGGILTGGGKPLTEAQTEKIKKIETGPDMMDKVRAELTDEQKKILDDRTQSMRENRGGDRGGERGGERGGNRQRGNRDNDQ